MLFQEPIKVSSDDDSDVSLEPSAPPQVCDHANEEHLYHILRCSRNLLKHGEKSERNRIGHIRSP